MKFLHILVAGILAGCSSPSSPQKKVAMIAIDNLHSVYYDGEGADAVKAKQLGDYLLAKKYFSNDLKADVKLVKLKDSISLYFTCEQTKADTSTIERFILFGGYISRDVFGNAPVSIQLCDDDMKPFKNIGYTAPVPAERIHRGN